jgi:putative sterol carrier protein
MATEAEMAEALEDYRRRCNENEKLRKMLKGWTRLIHFTCTDSATAFSVNIVAGEIIEVRSGAAGTPDLVIAATSEDFADMFWGDLNPAAKYASGEIAVRGSAEDVFRVDAMAALIWLD